MSQDDEQRTPPISALTAFVIAFVVARFLPASLPSPLPRSPGRHLEKLRGGVDKSAGAGASSPTDIPPRGWREVAWRTVQEINDHRLLAVAGGVTYFGLLALFPAIASVVALYGLFADAATINDHLASLQGLLPGGAIEVIGDQAKRVASKGGTPLGFAFLLGLAVSLWSANAGMKATFDALNIAYDRTERRGFLRLTLQSLLFTIAAIAVLLLALIASVAVPAVLQFTSISPVFDWVLWAARWPALIAIVILAVAVLYRYGPDRGKVAWRWITQGSILAAIVWVTTSMLFSWYVSNFGKYNETYGSLGAVIGFMIWMWLSTTIILIGAELNSELEDQAAPRETSVPGRTPSAEPGAPSRRR
jgi:membrane protein